MAHWYCGNDFVHSRSQGDDIYITEDEGKMGIVMGS